MPRLKAFPIKERFNNGLSFIIEPCAVQAYYQEEWVGWFDKSIFTKADQPCLEVEETKNGLIKQLDKLVYKKALNKILFLLSKKDYFTEEIRHKIENLSSQGEPIEDAIDKAKSYGYLNDDRLMKAKVRQMVQRGKGPYYLMQKLKGKRLFSLLTEYPIMQYYSYEQQLEAATSTLQKKRKETDKAKLYRYLMQQGFTGDVIQETLRSFCCCQS